MGYGVTPCEQRLSPALSATDEPTLADGPCALLYGSSRFPGHLYLTARRVRFEPGKPSPKGGGEPWTAEIASIRSARIQPADDALVIEFGRNQRRFSGAGARAVHDRLLLLLAERAAPDPEERVLLRAGAMIEVNDLLAATGELQVTSHRIRFQPNTVEDVVGLAAGFDDPVDDITGFEFTGLRHRLEVRSAHRTTRFMGEVLPALYGALRCLADVKSGAVSSGGMEYSVIPASLWRGPVTHPGALVLTPTRLAFVVTGLLDSLAGVQGLSETPVGSITSVSVVGRLEPRIEITAGGARATYACGDVNERYEHILAWIAARGPGPTWPPAGAEDGVPPPEVEALLAPWRRAQALPEVRVFTPAVGVSPGNPATPGFLVVGEEVMVWLPGPGPGGANARLTLPLGSQHWIWGNAREEIRVERDGTTFRWVTKAGRPFRVALFERVERVKERIALAWASSGTGVVSDGKNRRDSYRVQVSEQAQPAFSIWMAGEGEFRPLSFKLVELSLGGCSVRTQVQLPADLLLRVDLAENGRVHSVRAAVAYTRQRRDDQRWVAGLRFIDPPSDFDTVLRHLWMSLQQQQLRRLRGDPDPV